MPDTPTLAACLRAERDAWWATRGEYDDPLVRERQNATDQALAALEQRPTLAELEKAIGGLPLYPGLLLARKDVIAVLNELYRRGGA